jgi:phage-related minor tail protein
MTQAGSIFVKIDADVKEAFKGLDDLSEKMGKMGKDIGKVGGDLTKKITLPLIAVGGAMLGTAVKVGNMADRLLDLEAITGMTTDSIQEWQHVAKIAGVETESMTNAVEGLVKRIPQLESEGGRATEQMAKLGLSFDDLKTMSPDAQVDTLMKRLSDMEDVVERNAIGSSLFGGAWKDLAPILSMGSDGIEQAKNEAHELGNVMGKDGLNSANDFRIATEKMKVQLEGLFMELGVNLVPLMQDTLVPLFNDVVIPAIKNIAEWVGNLIKWFMGLDEGTRNIILIMIGLFIALGPVLVIIGQVAGAIAFLTSPIGLVVLAIAGLIAIGVLLWKNWDAIKEFAGKLWEGVKQGFDKLWNGIKNFFVSFMKGGIIGLINDYIMKPFFNIDLFQIGKDMINGLLKGAGSLLKNIGKFFLDLVPKWIQGPFKLALGIKSPSKVFAGYGENITEGLANGIDDGRKMIEDTSMLMSHDVMGGFEGGNMDISVENNQQQVIEIHFGKNIYRQIANGLNDLSRYEGRTVVNI